jgi:hypothetical protein
MLLTSLDVRRDVFFSAYSFIILVLLILAACILPDSVGSQWAKSPLDETVARASSSSDLCSPLVVAGTDLLAGREHAATSSPSNNCPGTRGTDNRLPELTPPALLRLTWHVAVAFASGTYVRGLLPATLRDIGESQGNGMSGFTGNSTSPLYTPSADQIADVLCPCVRISATDHFDWRQACLSMCIGGCTRTCSCPY